MRKLEPNLLFSQTKVYLLKFWYNYERSGLFFDIKATAERADWRNLRIYFQNIHGIFFLKHKQISSNVILKKSYEN